MKSLPMFRHLPAVLCGCTLLLAASSATAQEKFEFPAASPHATLKSRAGLTDIEIDYSRPSTKGREIFGGIVKWNEVWRTGANESTKITFSTPVKFGDKEVPAGKYALYTIPNKNEWTIILSKDTSLWGSNNYSADKDAIRFTARPATLMQKVETFTIEVGDLTDDTATLWLLWDRTAVPVNISLGTTQNVLSGIQQAVASGKTYAPGFYSGAANFYLAQNKDLPTALKWISQAVEADPKNFRRMRVKSQIQAKLGDKTGAIATLEKANEVNMSSPEPDVDELQSNLKLIATFR